jgi:hypothetical protein
MCIVKPKIYLGQNNIDKILIYCFLLYFSAIIRYFYLHRINMADKITPLLKRKNSPKTQLVPLNVIEEMRLWPPCNSKFIFSYFRKKFV